MDLLIVLTYVACAWSIFKVFKIPVNKWTVPTSGIRRYIHCLRAYITDEL